LLRLRIRISTRSPVVHPNNLNHTGFDLALRPLSQVQNSPSSSRLVKPPSLTNPLASNERKLDGLNASCHSEPSVRNGHATVPSEVAQDQVSDPAAKGSPTPRSFYEWINGDWEKQPVYLPVSSWYHHEATTPISEV
jgi:hypothetical protein